MRFSLVVSLQKGSKDGNSVVIGGVHEVFFVAVFTVYAHVKNPAFSGKKHALFGLSTKKVRFSWAAD